MHARESSAQRTDANWMDQSIRCCSKERVAEAEGDGAGEGVEEAGAEGTGTQQREGSADNNAQGWYAITLAAADDYCWRKKKKKNAIAA